MTMFSNNPPSRFMVLQETFFWGGYGCKCNWKLKRYNLDAKILEFLEYFLGSME